MISIVSVRYDSALAAALGGQRLVDGVGKFLACDHPHPNRTGAV